ncbi:MAG: hypothetical protein MOGMAGMI_00033 [Candidatus Omnitrophica bacterium]|nr:hypothetical protein [Candidatus Omnitrophota bacterium]
MIRKAALPPPAAWVLIGLCAVMAVLSLRQALTKPLSLDETDITIRAHMVIEHGPSGFIEALGQDEGMTHPPLYEYTVVLLFLLFGEHDLTVRLFGVVLFVIIGLLTWGTVRRSTGGLPPPARSLALAACAVLYLANPLLIQHTLLVDADSMLIALLVAAAVYLFVRFEPLEGRAFMRSRLGLAVCIALLFLTKEITPAFLVVSLVVYRVLNRQWGRLGADLVWSIGAGLALAAAAWGTYCALTGTRWDVFIAKQYNYRVTRVATSDVVLGALRHAPFIARWPMYWASTPLHVMTLVALVMRLGAWLRERRPQASDLCWVAGVIIWVPYFFVKASIDMMKYQQCAYPLFITGACVALASTDTGERIGKAIAGWGWGRSVLLALGVSAAAFYFAALGDPIPILPQPSGEARIDRYVRLYHAPLAVIYAAALICLWRFHRARLLPGLVAASMLLSLPPNLGLSWLQSRAPYTTVESWLNYGEKGLADTIDYLSTRVRPDQTVMLRKDIYYYLRCRYGIQPAWVYFPDGLARYDGPGGLIALETLMSRTPLDYIVLDTVSRTYAPIPDSVAELILRYYHLVHEGGDFRVFRTNRLRGQEV